MSGKKVMCWSLDWEARELIENWMRITGLSRSEIGQAISVWGLVKEKGVSLEALNPKHVKLLYDFLDRLGIKGVNLKYRAWLEIATLMHELSEQPEYKELFLKDGLVKAVLKFVHEKLLTEPLWVPFRLDLIASDYEKAKEEALKELRIHFPELPSLESAYRNKK